MLVRAIETADADRAVLSDDDRQIASRSARERLATAPLDPTLATQSAPVQFIAMRAALLLQRVLQRHPVLAKLTGKARHVSLAEILIPALALIIGIAVDRIADPHRVDLLSAPLLGILAWNLLVYVGILVWSLLPDRDHGHGRSQILGRWLQAGSNRLVPGMPGTLHAALLSFSIEWRRVSSALDAARIGRMMHLGAALFAAGATLSLYLRGFMTQYAAGWESTFLDPAQLQSILSVVFAPARAVFQLKPFSLADIEALRFVPGAATVVAGSGARWVHLYAATLLLLVILPRLSLAGLAHWHARRLQKNFPLSFTQPYFRHLSSQLGGAGRAMQVLPYSFALDAARNQALTQIAVMLLGDRAQATIEASTDYGAEASPSSQTAGGQADDIAVTAVLFNLAATPETQNHGAFLDRTLKLAHARGRQLLVLVDESGYRARLQEQAGADTRIAERRAMWQGFCQQHQLKATLVDLIDPERCRLALETTINGDPA